MKTILETLDETVTELRSLLIKKGNEYRTEDNDPLSNFRTTSSLNGATVLQNLHGLLSKPFIALSTYVKDDARGIVRERTESIKGRIHDLINYSLFFLYYIDQEEPQKDIEYTIEIKNSGRSSPIHKNA